MFWCRWTWYLLLIKYKFSAKVFSFIKAECKHVDEIDFRLVDSFISMTNQMIRLPAKVHQGEILIKKFYPEKLYNFNFFYFNVNCDIYSYAASKKFVIFKTNFFYLWSLEPYNYYN